MATKKSKRSASSKKSAAVEAKAEQLKQEAKPEADTAVQPDAAAATTDATTKQEEPATEEVVEVVEVEEPTNNEAATAAATTGKKLTISEKLADINPAALIAEMLGTFVLAAAFIRLSSNTNYGVIAISLILATITVVFGAISGAHFNPAISVAQWITRKINGVKTIAYVVAQVLGAILAFFALTGINNIGFDYNAAIKAAVVKAGITEDTINNAGGLDKWAKSYGGIDAVAQQVGVTKKAPKLYQISGLTEGKEWVNLISEILGSVVFGLGAAYALCSRKRGKVAAGLAMGISMLVGLAIAGSTGILNPAIAATIGGYGGTSIASVIWTIVVYALGPIIGVTIGVAVYRLLVKNTTTNEAAIEG